MSEAAPLRNVAVFQKGTFRGKTYTARDLSDIVRNFGRLSAGADPKIPVSTVLGHEEKQGMLTDPRFWERTDLPSVGWPDRLSTDGATLYADYDRPPALLRRLLANRAYRTVSAEIYDAPPAGAGGTGKVLRRLALLGGAVPEVKTLGDVLKATEPEPYSERFAAPGPAAVRLARVERLPSGAYACFSEVSAMDHEAMLAKLSEAGYDPEAMRGAPDQTLAECLRLHDDRARDEDDYDAEPPDVDDADRPAAAGRAQKMKAFAEKCAAKYGEGEGAAAPDKEKKPPPEAFSEADVRRIVAEACAQVRKDLGRTKHDIHKFAEERMRAEQRGTINARYKTLGEQGKMPPVFTDAGLVDLLYKLPADRLYKFAEGDKEVERSLADKLLDVFEKLPSRFAERFAPGRPKAAGPGDGELARVEYFSETPGLAHALSAAGRTPAQYVERFKELQKARPNLTAVEYGVPEQQG